MTTTTRIATWMIALASALTLALVSPAMADSKDAVTARMKARFPLLAEAKDAGKIGETPQGFAEAVKAEFGKEAAIARLLAEENADRKELYGLLAKEISAREGKEVSPAAVGELNATRIYKDAKPTDWFKSRQGTWFQKKDKG